MNLDRKQSAEVQPSLELSTIDDRVSTPPKDDSSSLEIIYSTGWRVYCTAAGIALAVGAITMEVSIIGTSLVKIVEALQGFERQGWVVTGYLIAYTSKQTKFVDIRKTEHAKALFSNIASLFIFTAFSGGCGASQTIDQLLVLADSGLRSFKKLTTTSIINRAFQGVGAAGIMSSGVATIYELVPESKYPIYTAVMTAFSALGGLAGPLIGGALSGAGQWRWVFLINVPIGAVILVLLIIAIPPNLPYQNNPAYIPPTWGQLLSRNSLARLDFVGTFFLLSGSALIVTAILEGGSSWAWDSATSIVLFILSGILFIIFLGNERIVSSEKRRQEPLFPFSWLFDRAWLGVLLTSILSSVPYNTITITLPQRFQIVEGDSPFRSGVRLIPFSFFIAIGGILTNVIAGKFKLAPIWLIFFGTVLESLGVGLLANLPTTGNSPGIIYFYEIMAGMGIGFIWGMIIVIPPFLVKSQDKDVAGGAIFQTRIFASAVGLSIATTVLNNYLTSHLGGIVGSTDALLQDPTKLLASLPTDSRHRVLEVFGEGYSLDAKIMSGFAAAQLLSTALLWRNPQVSLVRDSKANDERYQFWQAAALPPLQEAGTVDESGYSYVKRSDIANQGEGVTPSGETCRFNTNAGRNQRQKARSEAVLAARPAGVADPTAQTSCAPKVNLPSWSESPVLGKKFFCPDGKHMDDNPLNFALPGRIGTIFPADLLHEQFQWAGDYAKRGVFLKSSAMVDHGPKGFPMALKGDASHINYFKTHMAWPQGVNDQCTNKLTWHAWPLFPGGSANQFAYTKAYLDRSKPINFVVVSDNGHPCGVITRYPPDSLKTRLWPPTNPPLHMCQIVP
ncbi:MAG: hypothetical protein M1820_009633 [Bogoriella megaspora]|nr:MAG: hypothetical protein M1820_009633 [Bogoriella megaspora]